MLRLFSFLWSGCFHKWVEDERNRLLSRKNPDISVGRISYCHCERCGVHKAFSMRTPRA